MTDHDVAQLTLTDHEAQMMAREEAEAGPVSIDRRFQAFHAGNPGVYEALVRLAREARAQGLERVGIGLLWEVLRWELLHKRVEADGYKLNNIYRSRYARLIMANEPDLAGVFEVRELRS